MLLQTILIIILLFKLRKTIQNNSSFKKWNPFILTAVFCSLTFYVLSITIDQLTTLATFLSYLLSATVIYFVLTEKIFLSQKPLVYAFLPLFILNFIEDALLIIHRPTFKVWNNYLEISELFGIIWMVAMIVINRKQNKAIEKERLKAEEKEFRITEKLKAQLEVQVIERTAELTQQKEALQNTLHELEATQTQLIHSEKMASLGELTAGIAHEIQNPLNFVNNFSEINGELLAEKSH